MAQTSESATAALVENLRDARERVTAKGKEVAQTLDSEVHRSPWMYIGVAALLSALLGFFLGRGSRR